MKIGYFESISDGYYYTMQLYSDGSVTYGYKIDNKGFKFLGWYLYEQGLYQLKIDKCVPEIDLMLSLYPNKKINIEL